MVRLRWGRRDVEVDGIRCGDGGGAGQCRGPCGPAGAAAAFSSPAALSKAKLARLPPSNILEVELATALRAEGIDPAKLKTVAIEPGNIAAALADKTVDAAIGSAWEVPWLARQKGVALK